MRSARSSLILLGLAASLALAACGEDASTSGEVEMKLTADVGGVRYRLRNATFSVTQTAQGTVVSTVAAEANPGASSLRRTLAAGSYSISLLPAWRLERLAGAAVQDVTTQLVSQNPLAFDITSGAVTPVAFAFATEDTLVALGDGALNLTISVTEKH